MNTIHINFEALKKAHWSEQETTNAQLLVGFVQELMNNHNFDRVLEKYGNPLYRQHNRSIPDGMENLMKYVAGLVKRFPDYAYDVKQIMVDGDRVVFHSHITTNKKHRKNENKGFTATDIWRIENGQIAEHWDALQPLDRTTRFLWLLIGGKVANKNGLY